MHPTDFWQPNAVILLFQLAALRKTETVFQSFACLNFGKSARLAKKFLNALSKSFRLCCNTWLWQSLSHVSSFFPFGQQISDFGVTEFKGLISFVLHILICQSPIKHKTRTTAKLFHFADLCAVGYQFKFKGLAYQHYSATKNDWLDINIFRTAM